MMLGEIDTPNNFFWVARLRACDCTLETPIRPEDLGADS